MTPFTSRLSELTTGSPRQDNHRVSPNRPSADTAHQSMDRLSLSCEAPHDDPKENLDHLSLTSDEQRADSGNDRWM
ncbi:hypothetical protein SAMN05444166_5438 [Singulisphaera sp. GP187]|nr:hypothetical protein SAMN05444166_5438 [Singulisphaera sp. GP187]